MQPANRRQPSLPGLLSATLVASLLLNGCIKTQSESGVEPRWHELTESSLEIGRTTRSDVLELLGPPSQILSMTDSTAYYYLREITAGDGLVLIIYNTRRERTEYDRAVFFFDSEGKLTDWAAQRPDR